MRVVLVGAMVMTLAGAGCGWFGRRPPEPTATRGAVQEGVASWYGPGFHGKATTSGEVYDQNDLTAAHQTLPLGTRVAVTNLRNGRSIEVRVNDRGPFVGGRVIDLSYAAARTLDMVGPGTAPVRITVLNDPAVRFTPLVYTIQVGSFGDPDNAERLRERLAVRFDDVYVSEVDVDGGRIYRVRVGRFTQRTAAVSVAQTVTPLGLSPVVVEDGNAP